VSSKKILVENVRIVDPARQLDARGHLLAVDGRIDSCGEGAGPKVADCERIDAGGRVLAPGLWDIHVHLREPGQEDKETIATGCAAAAAGGFTDVVSMPNTKPPIDTAGAVELVRARAAAAGLCRVHPTGAITRGLQGSEMCEYGDMVDAGAIAFTDDGRPVMDGGLMRRAMEFSKVLNVPMITHAEDLNLSRGGAMHEGEWSTRLGLPGIPYAAEVTAIARDIELARLSGARLHVAHISCAAGVELLRAAKAQGLAVTGETAPHFLDFTHEDCAGYDSSFKMNPPLRRKEDQDALVAALLDGTIDCIATDHAPHTKTEKDQPFGEAPFGVIGLETSFAATHSRLVVNGPLKLLQLIELMSTRPAAIVGKEGGSLAPGRPADFTLIDVEHKWMPRDVDLRSKGRNCPWLGIELTGRVLATYIEGRPTFRLRGELERAAAG
jgi:dihydroorotase